MLTYFMNALKADEAFWKQKKTCCAPSKKKQLFFGINSAPSKEVDDAQNRVSLSNTIYIILDRRVVRQYGICWMKKELHTVLPRIVSAETIPFLNLTLCTVSFNHSTYRCGNYMRKYGIYILLLALILCVSSSNTIKKY